MYPFLSTFFPLPFMRFFTQLSAAALAVALSCPVALAKIYPDDFMIPARQPVQAAPTPAPTPKNANASGDSFFFASEIPDGKLTRAEFADAIGTRLYDADAHDNCFGDLILSEAIDYSLLYNDVSLDAPYASSVCVDMRNGIAQGFNDYTFRPNQQIKVSEAAGMLGDIGGLPLRDSNHVTAGEPWYQRYMDAIRSVDREFTMRADDILTGRELKHTLCVLKRYTPALDPLDEFGGGC